MEYHNILVVFFPISILYHNCFRENDGAFQLQNHDTNTSPTVKITYSVQFVVCIRSCVLVFISFDDKNHKPTKRKLPDTQSYYYGQRSFFSFLVSKLCTPHWNTAEFRPVKTMLLRLYEFLAIQFLIFRHNFAGKSSFFFTSSLCFFLHELYSGFLFLVVLDSVFPCLNKKWKCFCFFVFTLLGCLVSVKARIYTVLFPFLGVLCGFLSISYNIGDNWKDGKIKLALHFFHVIPNGIDKKIQPLFVFVLSLDFHLGFQ